MIDMISRNDAINTSLEFFVEFLGGALHENAQKELITRFQRLPSVQSRKGKWIRTRTLTHDGELYCNQCEQEHPEQKIIWNFCPNCGADMRGEQNEL